MGRGKSVLSLKRPRVFVFFPHFYKWCTDALKSVRIPFIFQSSLDLSIYSPYSLISPPFPDGSYTCWSCSSRNCVGLSLPLHLPCYKTNSGPGFSACKIEKRKIAKHSTRLIFFFPNKATKLHNLYLDCTSQIFDIRMR